MSLAFLALLWVVCGLAACAGLWIAGLNLRNLATIGLTVLLWPWVFVKLLRQKREGGTDGPAR